MAKAKQTDFDAGATLGFEDKQMDYILANPPFNLKKWGADKVKDDPRWRFGVPPDGNANYAWIQHMISHLKPTGRIGLVPANGALTCATGGEDGIRQKIIEADLVEGIVSLPPQLFYSVTIPVTLWFFNRSKDQPGKTRLRTIAKSARPLRCRHRPSSSRGFVMTIASWKV